VPSRAVEDFGLFEARPPHAALSGLAAIGGGSSRHPARPERHVATGSSTTPAELKLPSDVFDISKNQVGPCRAVFGLAPNSILTILKDQSDRYKRDLAQSSATSSGDSSVPSPG
jgi:hypothetical protein